MAAAAFRDAGVRWVCAGWTVFTVENLVMPFGAVHSALYISVLLLCRRISLSCNIVAMLTVCGCDRLSDQGQRNYAEHHYIPVPLL